MNCEQLPEAGLRLPNIACMRFWVWLMLGVWCTGVHALAETPTAHLEFFEREVRPVLAEHCYKCHGPERQRAELRLDHIEYIRKGGETGPVIEGADGRLIEAIRYQNVDFQMPPSGQLPAEAINALEEWVALGAPWPEEPLPQGASSEPAFDLAERRARHWAWQPLRAVSAPPVDDAGWARGAIDQFLFAALAAQELRPAPRADQLTLLRRAHFDLIGLPPSPEEIQAFAADATPHAFERLVDRLLASPHFGERWGRHWLDLVRFAETYGHEQDYPVPEAWRYRDYVIRALNADLPYDQFVREHIAGDLIPAPRIHPEEGYNESIIATGFWYMHQATHAPVDVRLDEADHIDNQIDVLSKAFLGMTVSCARCHDHKFDAISDKDYYAMAGFLRSSRQQVALLDPHNAITQQLPALRAAQHQAGEVLKAELTTADLGQMELYLLAAGQLLREVDDTDSLGLGTQLRFNALARNMHLDPEMLSRWIEALRHPLPAHHPLAPWRAAVCADAPVSAPAAEDTPSEVYADFSPGTLDGWSFSGQAFQAPVDHPATFLEGSAARLVPGGVVHSGLLSGKLQGVLRSPTFTLAHDHIHFRMAGRGAWIKLIVEGYQLRDHNGLLFGETLVEVNTGGRFVWHDMRNIAKYKGRRVYFEIIDYGDGYVALDEIRLSNGPAPKTAGEVRARLAEHDPAADLSTDEALSAAYARWAQMALERRARGASDWADDNLLGWLVEQGLMPGTPERLEAQRVALAGLEEALPAPVRVLAIMDGTPEDEHVFIRGNHKTLGELVPRRFLEAISGPEQPPITEGSGRLELADRLLDPANPLPARVMVNRIWHHLFGRGIVQSVDNFGELGDPPTHPELLDYLAAEFVSHDWSIKHLIREIMLSSAYQMSSIPQDQMAEQRDPANLLLHRMNVRRLEGEIIRDSILAVTQRLDLKMYGPSVPIHLSDFMSMSRRPAISGPMDGDRRRTIYVEVRRNFLSPMMLAFDLPLPDTTIGKRTVSNVPAQALTLMNDPFVVEQARVWGEALAASEQPTAARITAMWMQALGREPTPEEREGMLQFLAQQAAQYGLEGDAREKDVRLWADACHVLFMLKEFIFVA